MATQYTTENGVTLKRPGAYADSKVVSTPSTVAANGIIFAIGEADSGLACTEETDLNDNYFGPDQKDGIIAKYGSGQLVDAFVGAVSASNDDRIKGSFTKFYPVKTNVSTKASATIPAIGGGTFATLRAKAGGKPGNLISRTITAETAEVMPTTGSFILASPQVACTLFARVNGGAQVETASMAEGATPTAMVTAIDNLAGVTATGGVARAVIGTTRDITVGNISGYQCTFTATADLAVTPTVGDIMLIPTGSDFATANEGTYVVLAATGTIITALKVIDAAGTGVVRTAPSAEGPITASPAELECYSPVTVSATSSTVSPGLGKTLELAVSSTGVFSNLAWTYTSSTLAAATWVSTHASPKVITSSAEYEVNLTLVRQRDSISEEIVSGGQVLFTMGYEGTTGSCAISNGVMTLTLTGGSSSGLSPISITLADYTTVADLCQYLNSLGGFTAAPSLTSLSSLSPLRLDEGTYGCGSTHGAKVCRIKTDGADFLEAVNASILVDLVPPGVATTVAGLPDVVSLGFLAGGARGATTNASVTTALDLIGNIKGNFVVPLFSNNASVDIASGLTDSNSTYDIASINSAVRAHVLQMSQLKRRKRRLGVLSNRDTFANNKDAAGNIGSSRCAMSIQDATDNNASGTLTVFRPWMVSTKAAAMQGAGFYRDITHKYVTLSAVSLPGGGFNINSDTDIESALDSGILLITKDGNGSLRWESDQTTYAVDDNFVYNSLQAMYAADLISATCEERMERAFVGESLADISATTAKTVFGAILDDIRDLKLIARSDDAPRGFKNMTVKVVNGNALVCGAEVKLATGIKFVPIMFMISAVQQTA
jgi:hypothetical protein